MWVQIIQDHDHIKTLKSLYFPYTRCPQKMFISELFALLANEHFFWDTLYIKVQQFDLIRQTGLKHKPNIEVIASLSQAIFLSFCLHEVQIPLMSPFLLLTNVMNFAVYLRDKIKIYKKTTFSDCIYQTLELECITTQYKFQGSNSSCSQL